MLFPLLTSMCLNLEYTQKKISKLSFLKIYSLKLTTFLILSELLSIYSIWVFVSFKKIRFSQDGIENLYPIPLKSQKFQKTTYI